MEKSPLRRSAVFSDFGDEALHSGARLVIIAQAFAVAQL